MSRIVVVSIVSILAHLVCVPIALFISLWNIRSKTKKVFKTQYLWSDIWSDIGHGLTKSYGFLDCK